MSWTDFPGWIAVWILLASASFPNAAADPVDGPPATSSFAAEGAGNFPAQVESDSGSPRRPIRNRAKVRHCSLCHSNDLRRSGKHATTGKVIEPLAPSVNPKRLSSPALISKKRLLRNCKWTLGRESPSRKKGTSW